MHSSPLVTHQQHLKINTTNWKRTPPPPNSDRVHFDRLLGASLFAELILSQDDRRPVKHRALSPVRYHKATDRPPPPPPLGQRAHSMASARPLHPQPAPRTPGSLARELTPLSPAPFPPKTRRRHARQSCLTRLVGVFYSLEKRDWRVFCGATAPIASLSGGRQWSPRAELLSGLFCFSSSWRVPGKRVTAVSRGAVSTNHIRAPQCVQNIANIFQYFHSGVRCRPK